MKPSLLLLIFVPFTAGWICMIRLQQQHVLGVCVRHGSLQFCVLRTVRSECSEVFTIFNSNVAKILEHAQRFYAKESDATPIRTASLASTPRISNNSTIVLNDTLASANL
jgi:hypothetical protein